MSKLLEDLRVEQNHYKDCSPIRYESVKRIADHLEEMEIRIKELEEGLGDLAFHCEDHGVSQESLAALMAINKESNILKKDTQVNPITTESLLEVYRQNIVSDIHKLSREDDQNFYYTIPFDGFFRITFYKDPPSPLEIVYIINNYQQITTKDGVIWELNPITQKYSYSQMISREGGFAKKGDLIAIPKKFKCDFELVNKVKNVSNIR